MLRSHATRPGARERRLLHLRLGTVTMPALFTSTSIGPNRARQPPRPTALRAVNRWLLGSHVAVRNRAAVPRQRRRRRPDGTADALD